MGAVLALGSATDPMAQIFGFVAVVLASINIFGGFVAPHASNVSKERVSEDKVVSANLSALSY